MADSLFHTVLRHHAVNKYKKQNKLELEQQVIIQGSRLTVGNQPQTSKNSILASGFCTSLAILASENL